MHASRPGDLPALCAAKRYTLERERVDMAAGRPYMRDAMVTRLPIHVAVLALLPVLAAAQERPPTLPSRDVAVTYQVSGAATEALPGGAPGALRLSWDATGQRLRVSANGQPLAAIVDLTEGRAVILDQGLRTAFTLPLGARAADGITLAGAHFHRRGTEQVVGYACTDYAVQDQRGAGTLCVTADGVPLRGDGTWGGRPGRFVATQVEYAAQPDGLFRPPPGFVQLSLPRNAGTMGIAR